MSEIPANTIGEAGEPFDAALNRMLAAAPDRAELPDWRVRQAILQHAREAVKDSEELLIAEREPSAWAPLKWLTGKKKGRSGTPWRAAFATLAVAVLATVTWQREPAPGARPDAAPDVEFKRGEPARKEDQPAAREATPKLEAPAAPAAPAAPVAPDVSVAPAPAPAPAPPAVPRPTAEEKSLAESPPPAASTREASNAQAPTPSPASSPVAAAAAPRQSGQPGVAAGSVADAAPPGTRTDTTPPPNFVSLAQWRQMRIANSSGDVRILTRAEAGELNLLMGSAAIMAVGPKPLTSLPEWRVSLERNGGVLAVLEVSRTQVRWTEGATPPATGAPPAGALDALRAGLRKALESPVAVPVPDKPLPAPKVPVAPPVTPPAEPTPSAEFAPVAPAEPAEAGDGSARNP